MHATPFSLQTKTVLRFGPLLALAGMLGCGEPVPDAADTEPATGDLETEANTDTQPDAGDTEVFAPPSCGNEIDPSLPDADAAELFSLDHVPTFDIYLPEADWQALQEHAADEQYTEASACFDGRGIGTVGLRFKGSYGTLYECIDETTGELTCPRLSVKLKFNEYVEEQRFFGLKRLNFNANRYDDSRMKEKLAYDLYRAMGIIAPRSLWAVVRVNGQSYGLYGMVEQVDGRFTADRWPDNPDANVYKELWPTDTGEGAMIAALRTNEEAPDVSGFKDFADAFSSADEADLRAVLGKYTDLEHWARYMAVDEAVLSYDGIIYFWTDGATFHNHNYYFYEDAPSHFAIVPWDVESTFWINPEHAAPHWMVLPDDCDQTYSYWGGLALAPGCDKVFKALNQDYSAWREAAQELLDGPFALDTMLETIDRYAEFIGEAARAPETPTMYSSFDGAVSGMKAVIPQLRDRLEALIAQTAAEQ